MKLLKESSRLGKLAVTPSFHRNQPPKGLVWFLHGTCDSGAGLQSWVHGLLHREFSFYNQEVLYPTAPLIPYDLLNGQVSCVWYNRLKLSPEIPEDWRSIESTATSLGKLIKEETEKRGIPLSKVVLGGFSQGGSMALHLAYRLHHEVAGCFALSSFLPSDSRIYDALEKTRGTGMARENTNSDTFGKNESTLESQSQMLPRNQIPSSSPSAVEKPSKSHFPSREQEKTSAVPSVMPSQDAGIESMKSTTEKATKLPPLLMSHGTHDPLALHSWGKSTFSRLTDHGVSGQFYTIRKMDHTLSYVQLQLLHNWISRVLQDKPTNPEKLTPDGCITKSKGVIHMKSPLKPQ